MDLIEGTDARIEGASDFDVSGIAYRSDAVHPGDLFFCIRGFAHDGHSFARDAYERGAVAFVVEEPVEVDAPQFVVADTRHALSVASGRFNGDPSRALEVVGITGTNGKTTSCYLLDSILRGAGRITGLIGTVETRVGNERLPAARTTPESADLQALLARMRDAHVSSVSMEVSSHAIDLRRADGMRFAAVAFTNLTQDHLDFHHTIEEYFSVKLRLFTEFDAGARVVDIDDPFGRGIANEIPGVLTVGRSLEASVRAAEESCDALGSSFTLVTPNGDRPVRLPLAGAFNVSNALLAAGCALSLGIDLDTVVAGLESAPQVPGRLERIECGQPYTVVVDYAHTPDSLTKAISAVADVTEGSVIVVFGCGGDRDPDKRPVMGRAAGGAADYSVLTSDNPRSEDPIGIILQVEDGLLTSAGEYEIVVDRRQAIEAALGRAKPGDAVLIAGKGHEDYQIFAERTVHFDDREVVREVLGC